MCNVSFGQSQLKACHIRELCAHIQCVYVIRLKNLSVFYFILLTMKNVKMLLSCTQSRSTAEYERFCLCSQIPSFGA